LRHNKIVLPSHDTLQQVKLSDMSDIKWLEPWVEIETEKQKRFEAELKREVKPGHSLYQVASKGCG
jgi:hypothetical protein